MGLLLDPYAIVAPIKDSGRVLGTIDRIGSLSTIFSSSIPTAEIIYCKGLARQLVRMRFAQGWEWAIDVEGFPGLDIFIKDVTYGVGSIETEEKRIGGGVINKPTHRNAGTVTMVARDTKEGLVGTWFDASSSKVVNRDGTVNLPAAYLLTLRIYKLIDGALLPEGVWRVIPTERGEISRARDQVGEFHSFPMTFIKHSTFDVLEVM